tara:strand:- start:912 stop:2054 length:1143 start_codon:yes stop_codon:yes gene_type:complete
MKKKIIYVAIALIIIAVVFFLNRKSEEIPVVPEKEEVVTKEPTPKAQNEPKPKEDAEYELLVKEYGEPPADMPKSGWKKILSSHNAGVNTNTEVNFYGKVVDQSGEGVSGVKVQLYINQYNDNFLEVLSGWESAMLKKTDYTLITDENGLFSIREAKGRSLYITEIAKEGYLSKPGDKSFMYGSNYVPSAQHNANPSEPVVFNLWKKGEAEELVKGGGSDFSTAGRFKVLPNGEVRTINLLTSQVYDNSSQEGDIRFSLVRGEMNENKKYDWHFTLEAVDGGVVATDDEFGYLAPETGYTDKYEIRYNASDEDWISSLENQRFYIKSRNANIYSTILFNSIRAKYRDNGLIDIQWLTNPNGSRNLEYDPEKDVTKQYVNR